MYLQYVRPNAARPIRVTRRYDFRDNTPDSQGPRGPSAANRRQTTDRDRPERVNTVLLTPPNREFRRSTRLLDAGQCHAQLLKDVQSGTCTISAACAMARPTACARRESTRHLARTQRSRGVVEPCDSAVHGRRRDRAFAAGHSRRALLRPLAAVSRPRDGRSRSSSGLRSPTLIQNTHERRRTSFARSSPYAPSTRPNRYRTVVQFKLHSFLHAACPLAEVAVEVE